MLNARFLGGPFTHLIKQTVLVTHVFQRAFQSLSCLPCLTITQSQFFQQASLMNEHTAVIHMTKRIFQNLDSIFHSVVCTQQTGVFQINYRNSRSRRSGKVLHRLCIKFVGLICFSTLSVQHSLQQTYIRLSSEPLSGMHLANSLNSHTSRT